MGRRKREMEAKAKSRSTTLLALELWHVAVICAAVIVVAGVGYYWYSTRDGGSETQGTTYAVIRTAQGTVKAILYTEGAPVTTQNFIKLAKAGFYNGLIFHRIVDGYVVQGGGFYPDMTPKTSPYGTIPLEVDSSYTHDDGALAMARTNDPDSATSQFYICDGSQHGLDMSYAVFGKVVSGMEVVRALSELPVSSERPVNPQDALIISVTIVVE